MADYTDILAAQASTAVSVQYFRSAIYGTESVLNSETGEYEDLLDFMNYNVADAISATGSLGTATWDGTKPLTSIAFNIYGNTTLYWFILYFNGFTSVDDIPLGATLELPALGQINQLIGTSNTTQASGIGQVVSI